MQPWEAAGITPEDSCAALVFARVYEDKNVGNPEALIGVVVVKDEKFPDPRFKLPGGSREAGETPLDAAVRELFEETGLVVSKERVVFIDARFFEIPRPHWSVLFTADLEQHQLKTINSDHPENGNVTPQYFTVREFREEAAYGEVLDAHLQRLLDNGLVPQG